MPVAPRAQVTLVYEALQLFTLELLLSCFNERLLAPGVPRSYRGPVAMVSFQDLGAGALGTWEAPLGGVIWSLEA